MSTFFAKGDPGPPNELTVGTVQTGAAGTDAAAEIRGEAPDQTLHLTIPRGDAGAGGYAEVQVPAASAGVDKPVASGVTLADLPTFAVVTVAPSGSVCMGLTVEGVQIPFRKMPAEAWMPDSGDPFGFGGTGAPVVMFGFLSQSGFTANAATPLPEITEAQIDGGTASTPRSITGRRVKYMLDKKANASHTHTRAQVTGLDDALAALDADVAAFEAILGGGAAGQLLASTGAGGTEWVDPPTGGGLPPLEGAAPGATLRVRPGDSGDEAVWEELAVTATETRTEVGAGAEAPGFMAAAVGSSCVAEGVYATVVGALSGALSIMATGVGGGNAMHPGSVAIGGMTILDPTGDPDEWDPSTGDPPPFTFGPPGATTKPNQIRCGTAYHEVSVPGRLALGDDTMEAQIYTRVGVGGATELVVQTADGLHLITLTPTT